MRVGGRAQRQPSEPSDLQRGYGKHMVDRILDAPAQTQSIARPTQARNRRAVPRAGRSALRSAARADRPQTCGDVQRQRPRRFAPACHDARIHRARLRLTAVRGPRSRRAAERVRVLLLRVGGGGRVLLLRVGSGGASRGREPCGSSRTTREPVHHGALLVRQRVSAQSTPVPHVSTESTHVSTLCEYPEYPCHREPRGGNLAATARSAAKKPQASAARRPRSRLRSTLYRRSTGACEALQALYTQS